MHTYRVVMIVSGKCTTVASCLTLNEALARMDDLVEGHNVVWLHNRMVDTDVQPTVEYDIEEEVF